MVTQAPADSGVASTDIETTGDCLGLGDSIRTRKAGTCFDSLTFLHLAPGADSFQCVVHVRLESGWTDSVGRKKSAHKL